MAIDRNEMFMSTTDPNDDFQVSECVARSGNILVGVVARNRAWVPGNSPSQADRTPYGTSQTRAYDDDGDDAHGDDVYRPSRHVQTRSRKRTC